MSRVCRRLAGKRKFLSKTPKYLLESRATCLRWRHFDTRNRNPQEWERDPGRPDSNTQATERNPLKRKADSEVGERDTEMRLCDTKRRVLELGGGERNRELGFLLQNRSPPLTAPTPAGLPVWGPRGQATAPAHRLQTHLPFPVLQQN